MSSQSQLSVCNLALLSLGVQGQISSVFPSDGSTEANSCATLFTFVFESLARTAKWGCLNKQTTLTLLQAAQGTPENPTGTTLPIPQQPWLYGYLYPTDSLMMRQVLCPYLPAGGGGVNQLSVANSVTPWLSQQGQIPYQTSYATDTLNNPLEIILTNQEAALANYTVNQPNPQNWDSLLTSAFVASLSAYLVPALSLDKGLMQLNIGIAEKIILTARAADGNEFPHSQDHVPDFIQSRQGATGVYRNGVGYNGYNLIQMPWGC